MFSIGRYSAICDNADSVEYRFNTKETRERFVGYIPRGTICNYFLCRFIGYGNYHTCYAVREFEENRKKVCRVQSILVSVITVNLIG